jgi:hypothetical protein
VAMGILPHRPVATTILISNGCSGVTRVHCYYDLYIYNTIFFPLSKVHNEFITLSIQWLGKIKKYGGKVLTSFFLQGSLLQGKFFFLLKFFLLFRCVFEAMLMAKVNLEFHKLFGIKYIFASGV